VVPNALLAFSDQHAGLRVQPIALPVWSSPTMIITIGGRSLPPAEDLLIDTLRRMARSFNAAAEKGPWFSSGCTERVRPAADPAR
jgi:hypothetical protein